MDPFRSGAAASTAAADASATSSSAAPADAKTTVSADLGPSDAEGKSAGNTAAAIDALRFDLLRNIDYHGAREGWFAGWDRAFRFVSVFTSLGAITSLLGSGAWATVFVVITAFLQAFDLVVDFARRAREAKTLRQRFISLLAEIERNEATAARMREWKGAMTLIYSDEPPPLHALDATAWNNTVARMKPKIDASELIPLNWMQRWTRHLWAWRDLDSRTLGER